MLLTLMLEPDLHNMRNPFVHVDLVQLPLFIRVINTIFAYAYLSNCTLLSQLDISRFVKEDILSEKSHQQQLVVLSPHDQRCQTALYVVYLAFDV